MAKYNFKGKLRGIDFINSSDVKLKEALQTQVRMAAKDTDPPMSYKDVTMLPLNDFKEFLSEFNKVYNVEEELDFLEQK